MNTPKNTKELFDLYEERGGEPYGEAITQTEHALQCAALARAEGASDAMIAAALFHDVGHLVVEIQNEPGFKMDEDDDDHEAVGARVLAPLFGPAVAGPVALHVTAKRWRCSTDPGYYERLSEASKMTLKAQGGLLERRGVLPLRRAPRVSRRARPAHVGRRRKDRRTRRRLARRLRRSWSIRWRWRGHEHVTRVNARRQRAYPAPDRPPGCSARRRAGSHPRCQRRRASSPRESSGA